MPNAPDLALLAALMIAWPLYEAFVDWPAFRRRLRRDPAGARTFEYGRSMAQQWVLVIAALVLWARAGRPWADLGLRAPEGWRLVMSVALVAAFVALQALQTTAISRSPAARARLRKLFVDRQLDDLLPRDGRELGWLLGLSLTAGFVEELLFRGYVVAALVPVLGWWGAAAVSVVAFGLLHAYQGRGGMVRTAAVGAVMTLLVAGTRSLVPAMLLHAMIDIGSGTVGWLALSEPQAQPLARQRAAAP